jgi:hypothetical protein
MTWIPEYDSKKVLSLRLDKTLTDKLWEQAKLANCSVYQISKILLTEMLDRENAELHNLIMTRYHSDRKQKKAINEKAKANAST